VNTTHTPPTRESAVVLGSGGVLGIAWSIGVIAALVRAGMRIENVGLWIGTSAGSVVAAKLVNQIPVTQLLQEQMSGQAAAQETLRPYDQREVDAKNQQLFEKVQGDLLLARQRIGAWAQRSNTPPLAQRQRIIAQRLNGLDWPRTPLRIVSVNARTGAKKIWDHNSGISLAQAVTASCAVPGVWPVVPLQGEPYMDGGVRSSTNADLALGCRHVLVISPQGYSERNPINGHLHEEVDKLQARGASVHVVTPDTPCLQAMGHNILDPSRCATVAQAGYAQGCATQDFPRAFLHHNPSETP